VSFPEGYFIAAFVALREDDTDTRCPLTRHARKGGRVVIRFPTIAAAAVLAIAPASETSASWRCPAFYGAYYPVVLRCPNWEWDPNGPAEQERANAERRAAENRAAETRARAAADRLPPGQYLERLPTDDAATADAKAKINDERAHAEIDRREREAKIDKMNAEFLLRKHTSEDEERGYHHMTVLEFLADKNDLARTSAKVSISGTYASNSIGGESIFVGQWSNPITIGLLTDHATRETHMQLLTCRQHLLDYGKTGCWRITLVGHADNCSSQTLLGNSADVCLVVEDSHDAQVQRP
jgi:hypothetical protein